jgi:DUF971 family protein
MPRPIEIKKLENTLGLNISWSDGSNISITGDTLRRNCPCAECREQRGEINHAQPLAGKKKSLRVVEASLEQSLIINKLWPVGQYALGIAWADGHDSGIYSFDYLRQLSQASRP